MSTKRKELRLAYAPLFTNHVSDTIDGGKAKKFRKMIKFLKIF